jgi:hypothetical protein
MGEMRNAYTILVRKPEMRRKPGKLRHKWKNHIKVNLRRFGLNESVGWCHDVQARV